MKVITLLFVVFGYSVNCVANEDATRTAIAAINETEMAAEFKNNLKNKLENIINNVSFIDKKTAGLILASSYVLSSGEISTRNLQDIEFNKFGASIRPEIKVNFNQGQAEGLVMSTWQF